MGGLHLLDSVTGIRHDGIDSSLSSLLHFIKVILGCIALLINLLIDLLSLMSLSFDMLRLELGLLNLLVLLGLLFSALHSLLDHISLALLAAAANRSKLFFD